MATLGMPLLGMGQETPTLTSLLTARREREKQSKLADLLANAYGAQDQAQRQQYMQEAIRTDPTQGITLAKLLDPRFQARGDIAPRVVGDALVDQTGKVLYRSPEKQKQPEFDIRQIGNRLYYVPKSPMAGLPSATPPAADSGNSPAADAGFQTLRDAVMWQESRGNPNAVSPKGAMGTMQTMPGTLRDPGYGVAPAADGSPQEMERVGTDYLRAMTEKYGPVGGLAAYNWGPGNWERALQAAGGEPQAALAMAPRETQQYVPSVLGRVGRGGGAGMGFGVEQNAGIPAGAIPVPGLPDAPAPFRARQYTPQEVQQMGLPAGTMAYTSEDGTPKIVSKPETPAGPPRLSPGEASKVRGEMKDIRDAHGMFEAFDRAVTDIGKWDSVWDGKKRGQLGTAYNNARSALRVLYNTGVLQPGELPMLNQALQDPNSFSALVDPRSRDQIQAQLDELYRTVERQITNRVRSYPQIYDNQVYDALRSGQQPQRPAASGGWKIEVVN